VRLVITCGSSACFATLTCLIARFEFSQRVGPLEVTPPCPLDFLYCGIVVLAYVLDVGHVDEGWVRFEVNHAMSH